MSYVLDYEICALLFLIVVAVRFFCMRKFKNRSNVMFAVILIGAVLNITFDVIGSVMIDNIDAFAPWLNCTVNSVYYALQVAFPALMLFYVLILSGMEIKKVHAFLLIPALLYEFLLIINPFTGIMFYIKQTAAGLVYTRSSVFYTFYWEIAFYMILTIFVVIKYRMYFRKTEARMIMAFNALVFVAVILQFFYPRYLLTGVAISLAIFMMFLTMQNPGYMLDTITGTFNYGALNDYLRGQITSGNEIWISAVDVGGIRRINSTLGIRKGNELLERVGAYFNVISNRDVNVFRMIGTRFVFVSGSEAEHKRITDAATKRFRLPWLYDGSEVCLLATVRFSEEKCEFTSPDDILNLIDLAYAKVGEEGYGTTKSIDENEIQAFSRKKRINAALRSSIDAGKNFYLEYQPIYSVEKKQFCGAEALLRFCDSELGQISPAEFIPIAESSGLIAKIDVMVVKMACDFLRDNPSLVENGLDIMEINLSATEFSGNTDALYDEISRDVNLLENRICFEVTETALTSRRDVLSAFMKRLSERGIRFAVDDFGTGYANIVQIAKLPFSIVKLDRVFATQTSSREMIMLNGLVKMFDDMGLATVFEGIETAEQLNFAERLGINSIQGFYFSRPVSGEELAKIFGENGSAAKHD